MTRELTQSNSMDSNDVKMILTLQTQHQCQREGDQFRVEAVRGEG